MPSSYAWRGDVIGHALKQSGHCQPIRSRTTSLNVMVPELSPHSVCVLWEAGKLEDIGELKVPAQSGFWLVSLHSHLVCNPLTWVCWKS